MLTMRRLTMKKVTFLATMIAISAPAMAELGPKTQARFGAEPEQPAKSTKTAEALVPTGGVATPGTASQK